MAETLEFVLKEEAGISKLSYPIEFTPATKETAEQPQLLVRSCYNDLRVLALKQISARKNVVILGNSGIGKSGMLVHTAFAQLLEGVEVYFMFRYIPGESRRILRLQKDSDTVEQHGSARVTTLKVLAEFASMADVASGFARTKKEGILLVDGNAPQLNVRLPCILVASPKAKNYYDWAKNATVFYMGPWSKEELYAARDIFGVSKEQVDDRVERGGPFPLLVFNNPTSLTDSSMLVAVGAFCERGLTFSDEESIVHLLPPVDGDGNVNYREFAYDFNSSLCFQKFVEASGMEGLKAFVTSATFPMLRGLRAELPFAVKLAEGGSWRRRRLQPGCRQEAEGTLKLGGRVLRVLDEAMTNNNIDFTDEELYLPYDPNQSCWDAFFTSNGMAYVLQFSSVSSQHRMKLCFLETLLVRLGKSLEDVVMLFVLPPDRYTSFRFQKWLNSSGNVDEGLHPELMKQYAVSVSTPWFKCDPFLCITEPAPRYCLRDRKMAKRTSLSRKTRSNADDDSEDDTPYARRAR